MNSTLVNFTGRLHTAEAVNALWQWDYGQKLIIQGLTLPAVYEVHFCNAGDTETILQLGDASGVTIPDSCLKVGRNIYAYIFLHDGNYDGETVYKITIKVTPRPQPSDRMPDEEQRSSLDAAVRAVNAYLASGGGESAGAITDYQYLLNRPKINGNTVTGDMTGEELGLVNAVDGKGLSTNDFTDGAKDIVDRIAEFENALNDGKILVIHNGSLYAIADDDLGFVKVAEGKDLSSNDYADTDKQLVDLLKALVIADNDDKVVCIKNGEFIAVSPDMINVDEYSNNYTRQEKEFVNAMIALATAANNGKNIEVKDGAIVASGKTAQPEFNKKITLTTKWTGSDPYLQVITIPGYTLTENTKVDLLPDITTLNQMEADGVEAIYVVNSNNTLFTYAIGAKPTSPLYVTAIVSETE